MWVRVIMIANYLIEIIIGIFILLAIAFNFWEKYSEYISEKRCPSCSQDNAAQIIKDEFVGIFLKSKFIGGFKIGHGLPGFNTGNNYGAAMYEKYKLYNKCKFCGHEWVSYKSRRQ